MTDKTAAAPTEAAKPAEAAPEVGQMKRGDYLIHVFIEQARQLKCPEGTVDPLVEVIVLNEKKFTTAKDDVGPAALVTWNEHLFFEPRNLSVEQVEQAKIRIKVLDKGYFKDAIIGCYDFDIAYIYFMQKHSLMHKWLALSNPSSPNFNEVTGYLKLSISVSTTGDEQQQISEDTNADNGNDAILMPPSIRPEFYQVKFRFFRAEHLPAMDKSLIGGEGSIDAYIQCQYLSSHMKTETITAKFKKPIDWNEEFLIPCQLPIMSSRIVMKLYDYDLSGDEIVGSLLFNMKECIEKKNGQFFWKNIYGAPLGKSGQNTDLMNSNPDVASTWKGRVLMQVVAEKTEKPICMKRKLEQADVEAAFTYMQEHEFEIIAEVGQGISMPTADKYNVMIKIGDFQFKTDKPVAAENTYNRWSVRFPQTTYKAPYKDVYDIGKVYFYLMYGDQPVCYFKDEIENFMNPNPDWKWIEFLPDLSYGKVTEPHKAGIVSIKLAIHDKTVQGPVDFAKFEAWKKPPPKRLNVMKVRAFIFQCRDLPSADSDGTSDPFIRVWDTTKDIKKTKVIEDNNNPLFYETLELAIECSKPEDMPPFVLDIYDKDTLGEDFICRSLINLKDAHFSLDDEILDPKWHDCRLKPNAPSCGQILVSFSVVEFDYTFKTPLNYVRLSEKVNTQECTVDINILGLRDLQSIGILPVKKAFIVFNLKSLVPPEDGSALENIKTQPNSSGSNPTINTLIKFKVPLPVSELFCPRLTCSVHDYIFKGMSQPLIGTFTVPVGELLQDLVKERYEETGKIDFILSELDKIMVGEGVVNYSINQNEFRGSIAAESFEDHAAEKSQKMIEQAKKTIKVDDEAKQPLLFQDHIEEEEEKRSRPQTPSRLTPRGLAMQQAGRSNTLRKKTVVNPMKIQSVDKFTSGQKTLLKEQREQEERFQREVEDERKRAQMDFKKSSGGQSVRNILFPKYELDQRLNVHREVEAPPETIFIGLGWDENPEQKKKHYRKFYNQELEKVKEVMPVESPFTSFDIKRGQSRGASKSFFSFGSAKTDDSGAVSDESVVGKFKGVITVQTDQDQEAYKERKADLMHQLKFKLNQLSLKKRNKPLELKLEKMDTFEGRQKFELELEEIGVSHLQITKHLANLESDETLNRLLLAQTKCIVRLYVLSAFNLSSRDNGSESDPYLLLNLGNKTYNERDKYQLDEPNPDFYCHYDFESVFPGCPPLVIKLMDYDDIFGDDVIGQTSIDLEDRFFSPDWQSIKNKPIEYRGLYHPSTTLSQGTVKLWVEINPTAIPASEIVTYDIMPKPPEEFEVRVVIYDTLDVICMDAEGTSDVYCRAFFDSKKDAKETDTHYRCQNGKASFNYRLLYTVTDAPKSNYNFTIQLYDRDFFKSNDIIGEVAINLKDAILDAALSKRPLCINKKYYNDFLKEKMKLDYKDETSFWLTVKGKDEKTGQFKDNGKVRVQVDIYPKAMAETNKVGEARQEPNHSPFLPPPVGRLSFSLNPLKMFQQLVGPAMRRKIYCYCCIALCCALFIALFPLVGSNILSSMITSVIF